MSKTSSRLPRREVIAYGAGDISASLVWNAVSAFALLFYTDVAMLPAAAIGTLFFVSRIIDAGVDVGIGLAVDRTHSRWGRARPYLLFGAVPFGIFGVLTFYVPDLGTDGRFYYALFTYFILGLLLSVVTIPYSAMLPMMSDKSADRIDLSAARSVATSVGVIVVTALFMPGVAYFGQGDQERGFFIMGTLTAIAATVLLLYCFAQCKERVSVEATTAVPVNLRTDIFQMFRNRAWNVASGFALLNFIRFGALLSITPYFCINVLQSPWMISVLLPTLSGTLLVGAFLARPLLNHFGLVKTNIGALIVGFTFYAALMFCQDTPWLFITLYVLSSLAISITMTSIYAMASQAVDFHALWFGTRQEGLLAAGVSLAIKVGMAFGTAGVAYALAIGGYEAKAVSESAISIISWVYYLLPLCIFAIQIVLIRYYPSTELLNNTTR